VLAAGGLFGVGVALFPVSAATTAHLATTCISAFLLALWPALAVTRARQAPLIVRMPTSLSASILLFVLLGWTVYETQGGSLLGIAERVSVLAELLWPAIVVAAVHFRRPLGLSHLATAIRRNTWVSESIGSGSALAHHLGRRRLRHPG
jgi:hypothetical protein